MDDLAILANRTNPFPARADGHRARSSRAIILMPTETDGSGVHSSRQWCAGDTWPGVLPHPCLPDFCTTGPGTSAR
jgi:hypothetical protein